MGYEPIAKGEKKFAAVQPTEFTKDPAGNGPDLFSGAKTKVVDRKGTRLGKGPKQDMNASLVSEITDREWEGSAEDKRVDKKNGFKDGTPKDEKADKKMVKSINKAEKTVKEEQIDEGNKENKQKKNNVEFQVGFKRLQGVSRKRPSEKTFGRSVNRNSSSEGFKREYKEKLREEQMADHSDLIDLILNKNPLEFEEAYFEKLAERVTVLTEEFEKSIGATILAEKAEVKTEEVVEPVTEEYNEEEMFKLDESLDLTEANNVQTLRIKHSFHRGEAQKFSNEAIDLSSKAFRHGRSTEIGKHLTSTANELGKKADRHGEAAETAKQMLKKQGIDIWESVDDIDEESKAELAALAAAAMAKYKKPIHKVETGVTSGISGKEWKDAATGRTGKVEVTHREKKEKDELNPSATFKGTYAGAKFKGNVKH